MSNELTKTEATRFEACESIIENGQQTFMDVGRALLEIRDSHLYRSTHKTFDEYCRERWSMERTYAHRIIESSKISLMLPIDNKPQNESQVRPLVGIPEKQAKQAWKEASKDGEPTAAKVAAAVRATMPPLRKAAPVIDGIGRAVPKHLHALWGRRNEIQALLTAASKLRCALQKAKEDQDKAFGRANFQRLVDTASNLYNELTMSLAYAVCGYCQGIGCKVCDHGLVSKYQWDRLMTKEIKAAVQKEIENARA